jgi:hypothetical protein
MCIPPNREDISLVHYNSRKSGGERNIWCPLLVSTHMVIQFVECSAVQSVTLTLRQMQPFFVRMGRTSVKIVTSLWKLWCLNWEGSWVYKGGQGGHQLEGGTADAPHPIGCRP